MKSAVRRRIRFPSPGVRQALSVVLGGVALAYASRTSAQTSRQESGDSAKIGTISGRVIDSVTGRALVGATVKIAGTKLSVFSREEGRFVLPGAPAGALLLVTKSFGYKPAERSIRVMEGQGTAVTFRLVAAPNVLSGVITTATGAQDRRKIGQDVTILNVDSVMRMAPIKTVTDLLETRVPGLTVAHSSGVPGAPARIRIRGVSGGLVAGASTGNDPIVIVDGIRVYGNSSTQRDQNNAIAGATAPAPLDQIDPSAIETIEVFKGPSASAQFGPDAANGVILITTKRGRAGPMQVRTALDYGVSFLPGQYADSGWYNFGHTLRQPALSDVRYICDLIFGGGMDPNGSYSCVTDSLVRFQALDMPRLTTFGTGTSRRASVTMSGGRSELTYALTGTASTELGYFKMPMLYQDWYTQMYSKAPPPWMARPNRLNVRSGKGTLTGHLTPYLTLDYTAVFSTSTQGQSSAQGQLSWLAGTYIDTAPLVLGARERWIVAGYVDRIRSRTSTFDNAVTARWSRWSWLPMQATLGVNLNDRQDDSYVPFGVDASILDTQTGLYTYEHKYFQDSAFVLDHPERNLSRAGRYAYSRPTSVQLTARETGTLFPHSRVVTDLGFDFTHAETHDFAGMAAKLSQGVTVPATFSAAEQHATATGTGGWFLAPRFTGNRLFFSPGFRVDSRSGTQKGTAGFSQLLTRPQVLFTNPRSLFRGGLAAFLPKMDLSWIAVDRQGQAPLLGALTFLRPRVAFGTTSVQPDPAWLLRTYATATPVPGVPPIFNIFYPGIQMATIGNPILRPERKRELEYGAEMQFWENRLTLNTSGYYQLRYDAIMNVPVAPSAGGMRSQQYRNIASTRGVGVEVTADAVPFQSASASWSVRTSLSTNREVLSGLADNYPAVDLGNSVRLVPGYPLNSRWDRPIVGYDVPRAGHRVEANDIVLADSLQYMGSATPGYTLPVSTQLSLLGGTFHVNAEFNYVHGVTQFGSGSVQALTSLYLDPAASPGQQAAAMAAYCDWDLHLYGAFVGKCNAAASRAGLVQTINVLRWQDVSVSYTLPRGVSRRLRLPGMTVAVQGSNLGLWSNYGGKDPDVNGTPVGEALEDSGQMPRPRTWGVSLTFERLADR